MNATPLFDTLRSHFPHLDIHANVPLAPYTTLKIGGPATVLLTIHKQSELFDILKYISSQIRHSQFEIRHLHFLGLGSNVLIPDSGLAGLTIRNLASKIEVFPKITPPLKKFTVTYTQRQENEPEKYLDFSKIDYDESGYPTQDVLLHAGTPLPLAINTLISQGLTGLQWFAYIPGTVGGAVYQNIHGGKYHFSDYIVSVKVFDLKSGKTQLFRKSDLNWQYETSFFQSQPHLIILAVRLRLFRGDATLARQVHDAWIAQKSQVQPMNSAGSAFANPSLSDCQRIWGEQKSTGWIIDHELNLKGYQIGCAQISPIHANFIVNTCHANPATAGAAADYQALVKHIQDQCFAKFGLKLIPEVKFLG